MSSEDNETERPMNQMDGKDNDWMVLDEWLPEEQVTTEDNSDMSDDSTNCSEAYDRLTSYSDLSDQSTDDSYEYKTKKQKKCSEFGHKRKQRIYSCDWLSCDKRYNHFQCFRSHLRKHSDSIGHNFGEEIMRYSLGYFTYNGIEDMVKTVEENNKLKYICKSNDCLYQTLWSYQLVIHIRSQHTCAVQPFVCDWFECNKKVTSNQAFSHRLTHFNN